MYISFVHQSYPAQFGHIARHVIRALGWQCTFVSKTPPGDDGGIRKIQYKLKRGAREANHYCVRTLENAIWNTHGVFDACKAHDDLKPDLIIGHSGFGSTLFLPDLYPDVPIINYFEYYYHAHQSDMDFRPEFQSKELDFLRARARNAMVLLDLSSCRVGHSPTRFQRDLFPNELRSKIEVIFDGVDTEVYRRREGIPRRLGDLQISPSTRIVTYVSRGFESMRGFDIFMRSAKRIYERFPNVLFVVLGSDRIYYGGDGKHIQEKTFREHVLSQDHYDLSKFVFTGLVPPLALVDILSLSDLHIYLTVPFVLSWSLMNALACGCAVLASDTPPVREMITDGENGLLVDFYDVEGFAAKAVEVLRDPTAFAGLGQAGSRMIADRYALDRTISQMVSLFQGAVGRIT